MTSLELYLSQNVGSLDEHQQKKFVAIINKNILWGIKVFVDLSFEAWGSKDKYYVEPEPLQKYNEIKDGKYYIANHLGGIEASLFESENFIQIYRAVEKMVVDKFGNWHTYYMYLDIQDVLEDIDIDSDFKLTTLGTPHAIDVERLICTILGFEPEIRHSTPDLMSWKEKTSRMTLTKYKNDTIKVQGLSVEQWMTLSSTIQELKEISNRA